MPQKMIAGKTRIPRPPATDRNASSSKGGTTIVRRNACRIS
jgi:hypothetical protein